MNRVAIAPRPISRRVSPASGRAALPQKQFRTDIEGLRAVAVIAVVLFHAGLPGVGGGFIGVDVFFVVSGFLITRLVTREIARTNTVGLANFWKRRARRLLPALYLLLAVVVGYALLFVPDAIPLLRGDVIAACDPVT